ncbi:glycerol-3-phosphate dehydrogenase [Roseomonas arctica]|uniref:Glycerol-3-phosphate dehydrogenase n=1 Tax=Plastoroseomonas arctica TaxID=1509237 RepID=A0AAF1KNZ0_9PROT|nr:glycerol-3-phosphate dehydrogenase [Plastoroseomonas arctica]
MERAYDIAVIGGGINGAGIARDAAGRGLSVFLCEMNDLASGTSSWSTKLVHGGLRYLEFYEFRLVREALAEREILWAMAPHVIGPLRFVLPHHKGLRPAWLLRLGLFLYDHLGGRRLLPPTRTLDLRTDAAGLPLKPGLFAKGFEYSDCRVDDSRLVVLNALDAAERGATIATRTALVGAERQDGAWHLRLRDTVTGEARAITARALVNAAGPWVSEVLHDRLGRASRAQVRLVQGSHIVVPKLYDHDRCYIVQTGDGRIVFAIPYEGEFTLVGTTDRDYQGDPAKVAATAEEIAYLCAAVNEHFAQQVSAADVVWAFSGVRPLYDDGASEARAATRDYVFEMDSPLGEAPLLSIFGGKITTYRRLAEAAVARLAPLLGAASEPGWTAEAALPGGDFPVTGRDALAARLRAEAPTLSTTAAARLAATYGTRALRITGCRAGLGRDFGGGLSEAELGYLMDVEWARTAEDVLWRRTKLGLHLRPEAAAAIDDWMRARSNARVTS